MAANWRKVVVSGSVAELNSLSVDNAVNITGSLNASSSVLFAGLTNASEANIVSIDITTGQLFYQGTGSFTASSASFATSASQAESSSYAVSASQAESASYAISASHAINADTASSVGILNQPVIISGSLAINTTTGNSFDINADTFTFTGSLSTTGSVSFALTPFSASYLVGYDPITGNLYYEGTGSVVSVTASHALTASYVNTLHQDVIISGALYVNNGDGMSTIDVYTNLIRDSINSNNSIYLNDTSKVSGHDFTINASYVPSDINLEANFGNVNLRPAAAGTVTITGSLNVSSGVTGSFSGSFSGDGSQLTGVSASVLLFSLSQSTGITPFDFNGSAATLVQVSGSDTLSSSSVVLWTGDAFKNSSITDADLVTINNGGGVLIQTGGLYVTGSSTFHDNVVVQGDLTVYGTASFQNTQNLAIADQFILLNSGSATFQDSGFVIATGNSENSGSAFFLETAGTTTGSPLNGRFAVAGGVNAASGSVTAESYMNTTVIDSMNPNDATPPAFGGSGLGQGNMWVNSSTSDIWIYA